MLELPDDDRDGGDRDRDERPSIFGDDSPVPAAGDVRFDPNDPLPFNASASPTGGRFARHGRRRFSLGDANRALVLVRRIVQDAVWTHESARRLHQRLEGRLSRALRAELEQQLERAVTKMQNLVDELRQLGAVELRDYRLGLVAFHARHAGRELCWCWRLGEDNVAAWHEPGGTYAGRRPVSELVG